MTDLQAAADVLGRAADRLEKVTADADGQQRWYRDHESVWPGEGDRIDVDDLDNAEFIATVDPHAAAALVPVLRDAALNVRVTDRGVVADESHDLLLAFARRVLRSDVHAVLTAAAPELRARWVAEALEEAAVNPTATLWDDVLKRGVPAVSVTDLLMLAAEYRDGARMIHGVWFGDTAEATAINWDASDGNVLTVMFSAGDTETVRRDVEYDVVDPDSQVAPDGSPTPR